MLRTYRRQRWGLGFRVEDLGFRVEDLGFRVEDLGSRASCRGPAVGFDWTASRGEGESIDVARTQPMHVGVHVWKLRRAVADIALLRSAHAGTHQKTGVALW